MKILTFSPYEILLQTHLCYPVLQLILRETTMIGIHEQIWCKLTIDMTKLLYITKILTNKPEWSWINKCIFSMCLDSLVRR